MTLNPIKSRARRARESERTFGRWLLEHDGLPEPTWRAIMSSTGRVGHYYNLKFDCISKTYCGENKNVKLPPKILEWWTQIIEVSGEHGKEAVLRIEPSN